MTQMIKENIPLSFDLEQRNRRGLGLFVRYVNQKIVDPNPVLDACQFKVDMHKIKGSEPEHVISEYVVPTIMMMPLAILQ